MFSMIQIIAAEKGEPTDFIILNFIAALIVFGLAIFISGKFIWPKITGALDARDAKIRNEIEAAEKSRANADKALEDYKSSLAEARAEAAKMIEQTKAEQVVPRSPTCTASRLRSPSRSPRRSSSARSTPPTTPA